MKRYNWSFGPVVAASFGLVLVVLIFSSVVLHRNLIALHAAQDLSDQTYFLLMAANLTAVILATGITILAWYLVDRELRVRRSAETHAHIERQNLLVTLNSIGDGVIVSDAKARVKLINPSALKLIGNPQGVIGSPVAKMFSIVKEATGEPIEHPVDQVLTQGRFTGITGQTILVRKDGTQLPIEQSATAIHDASGKVTGCVYVFRDFSVRRDFEREMRAREKRSRRVFETPLIGIAMGTSRGELLEANDAFLDLIGGRRKPLKEMELSWDGVTSSQSPLDEESQRELREHGVCKPFERRYTRADGTRVPVLISAARLTDEDDRVVVFVTDLTQAKQAEAALLESEARFRVLSECMPQKVWTARPDGEVDYLNHMLLDYVGLSEDELHQRGWKTLLHPDDVDAHANAWRESLSTGNMLEIESRIRNRDGQFRWHLARALPVYRPDGDISMWVGTNTDIHAQKQAEQSLRDDHQRKDDFLALLAHELRNPLAPLSNAIQVFPTMQNDPKGSEELLNIMRRQIRQLTRLIDDLLDLARITTGRLRLRSELIPVNATVSAAVEAVQPLVTERGHQLTVTLPDDDLTLEADAARLAQILTNLLHNAAKFTDQGGRLSLTVVRVADQVEFRIKDNGPGITNDMLTRIFDLYTQAELTLDRAQGGLGIGLTLVRNLVRLHGGTITATSPGPGLGSEFVVHLPIVLQKKSDSEFAIPVTKPPADASSVPALRVLVVDDVQASAKTLALMLKSLGQNVELAFDGPTALTRMSEVRFDLVFLDIAMPVMDGLQVARRIRSRPEFASVMLIALTGFDQDEDRSNTRDAGFNAHLTKPTSLEFLKDSIKRAAIRSAYHESLPVKHGPYEVDKADNASRPRITSGIVKH